LKKVPISDKESYSYIRLRAPGEALVKMFWTSFNQSCWWTIITAIHSL